MRAFLFLLILLFAVSCGDDEEADLDESSDRDRGRRGRDGRELRDNREGLGGTESSAKERVKKDCDTQIIKKPGSECEFSIFSSKHGETYTTQYKEISNSRQYDGVKATFARGKWICKYGKWHPLVKPICMVCPAGPLFTKCLAQLEEEEEMWRRWQEAQRFWKGTDEKIDLTL